MNKLFSSPIFSCFYTTTACFDKHLSQSFFFTFHTPKRFHRTSKRICVLVLNGRTSTLLFYFSIATTEFAPFHSTPLLIYLCLYLLLIMGWSSHSLFSHDFQSFFLCCTSRFNHATLFHYHLILHLSSLTQLASTFVLSSTHIYQVLGAWLHASVLSVIHPASARKVAWPGPLPSIQADSTITV